MGRFDWMEGCALDGPAAILAGGRWEARRKKVLTGKPGKAALAELHKVLLAMPHKRLIEGSLCDGEGVCAVGAWVYRKWVDEGMSPRDAWKRLKSAGLTVNSWDEGDYAQWKRTIDIGSRELGITRTLAEVVSFVNDDDEFWRDTPEQRYDRLLRWVENHKGA